MKLDNLRSQIDKVDLNIIILLQKRLILAEKIGGIKKNNNLNIRDRKREKEVYRNLQTVANSLGLDQLWLKKIFALILSKSKAKQSEIR